MASGCGWRNSCSRGLIRPPHTASARNASVSSGKPLKKPRRPGTSETIKSALKRISGREHVGIIPGHAGFHSWFYSTENRRNSCPAFANRRLESFHTGREVGYAMKKLLLIAVRRHSRLPDHQPPLPPAARRPSPTCGRSRSDCRLSAVVGLRGGFSFHITCLSRVPG